MIDLKRPSVKRDKLFVYYLPEEREKTWFTRIGAAE